MTKRALIVVDVQNDFCEGGALGVAGGNKVAEGIAELITVQAYPLVFASQDWHMAPPNTNCGHFALEGEPDFVRSWPVHCVQNTDGAKLHPALEQAYRVGLIDYRVFKGSGMQSYSAFEGVTADYSSLLAMLRSFEVTDLDVCGIATDYCVRASVLDALGLGFEVRVLLNLCAGVAKESSDNAVLEMAAKGALIV